MAHSGDHMVSIRGVRAQARLWWVWDQHAAATLKTLLTMQLTLNFDRTLLGGLHGPSWEPAVCSALLVFLSNRLQSLGREWFCSILQIGTILLSFPGGRVQGLGKLSSSCRPHLGIEHSLSSESTFPLSLERCWCAGLWQSLWNPESSLSMWISQDVLLFLNLKHIKKLYAHF